MYIKTEEQLKNELSPYAKTDPKIHIQGHTVTLERKIKGCSLFKEIVFQFFAAIACCFFSSTARKAFQKACKGIKVQVLHCSKNIGTQKIQDTVKDLFSKVKVPKLKDPNKAKEQEELKLTMRRRITRERQISEAGTLMGHFMELRKQGNWVKNTLNAIENTKLAMKCGQDYSKVLEQLEISIHPYFCYLRVQNLLVADTPLDEKKVAEARSLLTYAITISQEPYLKNILAVLDFDPQLLKDHCLNDTSPENLTRIHKAIAKGFVLASLLGAKFFENNEDNARHYYRDCPQSAAAILFFAKFNNDNVKAKKIFDCPSQPQDLDPPSGFLSAAYEMLSNEEAYKMLSNEDLEDTYIASLQKVSKNDPNAYQLLAIAYESLSTDEGKAKAQEYRTKFNNFNRVFKEALI